VKNVSNRRRVRRVFCVVFAAALLLPVAPAQAEESNCATTPTAKTPWFNRGRGRVAHRLKLRFCVDGRDVKVEISGKQIGWQIQMIAPVEAVSYEYVLRGSDRKVLEKAAVDIAAGDDVTERFLPNELWSGFTWSTEEVGSWRFATLPAGSYQLEMRLVVDWNNDGRGPRTTGWKKVRFVVDAASPPVG